MTIFILIQKFILFIFELLDLREERTLLEKGEEKKK